MTVGNNRLSPILTAEGGIAIPLINKTGAASIKGTIVESSPDLDGAVEVEESGGIDPMGVIYQDGIPDGEPVLVVIAGVAEILIENDETCNHGDWLGVSEVTDGRAECEPEPPGAPFHDKEVGHSMETIIAGTDVLAKGVLHYR